jgi:hypothetical protein
MGRVARKFRSVYSGKVALATVVAEEIDFLVHRISRTEASTMCMFKS